jgi:predicted RNA-binding protein (TIGR00451 family)
MKTINFSRSELYQFIHAVLSYQFNDTFANAFLSIFDEMKFEFSRKTGKLKHIYQQKVLQANYRPTLGTFSISLDTIKRIKDQLDFPQFRVQVLSEVSDFIAQGKSVFAKHVVMLDKQLRVGDEVIVVDEEDNLLAIGKLTLPPVYFPDFKFGSAVKVRKGIKSSK